MPGRERPHPSDALQQLLPALGQVQVHPVVEVGHVDSQLQRGGGDHPPYLVSPEPLLDAPTVLRTVPAAVGQDVRSAD